MEGSSAPERTTSGNAVPTFAGGGGASTGIQMALGRSVDVAVNHDPEACGMHRSNHPLTYHCCEDIFAFDLEDYIKRRRRRVGAAWFSPDCKHFSKAKGGGDGIGCTKAGKGVKIMIMVDAVGLPVAACATSAGPHESTLVQELFNFMLCQQLKRETAQPDQGCASRKCFQKISSIGHS